MQMNIIHFIFIFLRDCNKHDIQSYLQEVLVEILAVWNPDLLPVYVLAQVNMHF